MRLNLRAKSQPEVNLTSLIDVVLLLLIFFMVSTSFVKESQISVTLPEAESEAVVDEVTAGSRMEGYLDGMSALMDQYTEGQELPLLEKIGKPTLIIWGAADRNKPTTRGNRGNTGCRFSG